MVYSVSAGSTISNVGGHGVLHHYTGGPALSSNLRLKKHIAPLEILSEASTTAEETDAESLSEATGSLCSSPTCTKESSSDESAKLLVQQFASSEYPRMYGNELKGKCHGALPVQQSHNFVTKKAEKLSRIKVSFQGETESSLATEISKTRMHKPQISTAEAIVSSANSKETFFKAQFTPEIGSTAYRKPRSEGELQHPPCALKLHIPALTHGCFPLGSSRAADLMRRSSNTLFKLRGFIYQLWQRSSVSEDDGDLILGHLSDTNMDDVNEMKALLNNINQNLKMLETRSRAHPQLLSSKLAPVYFTT